MVWEAKWKVGLEDLKIMWAGVPGLAVSNSLASIAGGREVRKTETGALRQSEKQTKGQGKREGLITYEECSECLERTYKILGMDEIFTCNEFMLKPPLQ